MENLVSCSEILTGHTKRARGNVFPETLFAV
jgi:hypothetical protein